MRYFLALLLLLSGLSSAMGQGLEVRPGPEGAYSISIPKEARLVHYEVSAPRRVVGEGELPITIKAVTADGRPATLVAGRVNVEVSGTPYEVTFEKGEAMLSHPVTESAQLQVSIPRLQGSKALEVTVLPGWVSLLPPLIAIAMALIFREVVISIFLGIFIGALLLKGFYPADWVSAFLAVVDEYILPSLLDSGHMSVIIFSTLIGGMVAVISKNGGMAGVVDRLSRYATTPRSAQLITWFLGIAIFFDDYANTLIVGNTMRPVTDRFRISREKLAYIVDSTAAPVAAIAFVTTWIGAELGYIKDASENLGLGEGAYSIFLNSLEYSFYPILTIIFMFMLLWMRRDFGYMHKADARAATTGVLNIRSNPADAQAEEEQADKLYTPDEGTPRRLWNALLPVVLVVLTTLVALIYTGLNSSQTALLAEGHVEAAASLGWVWAHLQLLNEGMEPSALRKLGIVIGNSDAYVALLWSSLTGLAVAIALTVSQGIMSVTKTMEVMIDGFKTMLTAVVILTLAWSLSKVTEDLNTADYLTSLFTGNVAPAFLPTITFLLAAVIAFSTGSSWGTMAILYPLLLPTTWAVSLEAGLPQAEAMEMLYHVTAVVLAGSVFGDHCSPISDTTILSSLASDCNHVEHVRTQMPYALTVAGVSILLSLVFANLGTPWYLDYAVGILILFLIVRFVGKPSALGEGVIE